jgi:hypothetical protein
MVKRWKERRIRAGRINIDAHRAIFAASWCGAVQASWCHFCRLFCISALLGCDDLGNNRSRRQQRRCAGTVRRFTRKRHGVIALARMLALRHASLPHIGTLCATAAHLQLTAPLWRNVATLACAVAWRLLAAA